MPVPVLHVSQMRAWEKATWAAGQTESAVIARVGLALAQRALDLTQPGDTILILAGKGHNGDDARLAAPHLGDRVVHVLEAADPRSALEAFLNLAAGKPGRPFGKPGPRPALVVDGLFGLGLDRPLNADWQALVQSVNSSGIPVLAVDVPSGLNAESGQVEGAAIRARVTLTVGAPKYGLLQTEAAPYVGRLEVAEDVGFVPCPEPSDLLWTLPEDFQDFPPARSVVSHKGSHGHAVIMAGSYGYHGAAVLAARAALRAWPGLVTVLTTEGAYSAVASQLQSAMVRIWQPGQPLPESCTVLLAGPGLAGPDVSAAMRAEVEELWRRGKHPMMVDASALDWMPRDSSPPALRLMTPHPGEAARLLQASSGEIQASRLRSLRELSARHGQCQVILKGHQTLIGSCAGSVRVNSTGNPGLAQGGSGDVLAGFLAGLLAQPTLQQDMARALSYGVWKHGQAADQLGRGGRRWTIEDDLVPALG